MLCSLLAAPFLCVAEDEITLVVTRRFSSPPRLEKKISAGGKSCMDILKSCADVETAYGGGFVAAINGIKGGGDGGAWFYYVNGLMADVGADRYLPRPGDVVQWDHHRWNSNTWLAAIIGSYPQPFLSRGCRILHSSELAGPSRRLAEHLKGLGAHPVSCGPLGEGGEPAESIPLIVVGGREDLLGVQWTKNLIGQGRRAGLFIDFGKAGMKVFNVEGQSRTPLSSAGAIVALKRGYGSTARPLWIVTGTDEAAVLRCLELLLGNPEKLAFRPGVVVTEEGVENVPRP